MCTVKGQAESPVLWVHGICKWQRFCRPSCGRRVARLLLPDATHTPHQLNYVHILREFETIYIMWFAIYMLHIMVDPMYIIYCARQFHAIAVRALASMLWIFIRRSGFFCIRLFRETHTFLQHTHIRRSKVMRCHIFGNKWVYINYPNLSEMAQYELWAAHKFAWAIDVYWRRNTCCHRRIPQQRILKTKICINHA